jgi:hypothetical protein
MTLLTNDSPLAEKLTAMRKATLANVNLNVPTGNADVKLYNSNGRPFVRTRSERYQQEQNRQPAPSELEEQAVRKLWEQVSGNRPPDRVGADSRHSAGKGGSAVVLAERSRELALEARLLAQVAGRRG